MLGDGITYGFLFQDDPEPRDKRKAMLTAICWIARGKYQQNKKVLGIATEMKIRPTCSYDFCLMDLPTWTEENQKNMEQLQKETGIFVNPTVGYTHEDEYPKVDQSEEIGARKIGKVAKCVFLRGSAGFPHGGGAASLVPFKKGSREVYNYSTIKILPHWRENFLSFLFR